MDNFVNFKKLNFYIKLENLVVLVEKYIKVFDYLVRKLVRRSGLFEKHD